MAGQLPVGEDRQIATALEELDAELDRLLAIVSTGLAELPTLLWREEQIGWVYSQHNRADTLAQTYGEKRAREAFSEVEQQLREYLTGPSKSVASIGAVSLCLEARLARHVQGMRVKLERAENELAKLTAELESTLPIAKQPSWRDTMHPLSLEERTQKQLEYKRASFDNLSARVKASALLLGRVDDLKRLSGTRPAMWWGLDLAVRSGLELGEGYDVSPDIEAFLLYVAHEIGATREEIEPFREHLLKSYPESDDYDLTYVLVPTSPDFRKRLTELLQLVDNDYSSPRGKARLDQAEEIGELLFGSWPESSWPDEGRRERLEERHFKSRS